MICRMKKIVTYIVSAFATACMLVSCNLELEPTYAIVIKDNNPVIYTYQDLNEFESRIMSYFRSLHGGSLKCIEDVMLDEFNATAGFGNNYGDVHRTDASYTSSDSYIESYWSSYYYAIKEYNFLIDALYDEKNIPEGAENAAALIQGEAYMFRADAYLNLVRHFGKDYDPTDAASLGVPLVLHYDLDARPARNTVHEVYAQIKEDLDSAAVRLADVPGEVSAIYPTIDAVNFLLARYCLDVEDYDNAIVYADKVISTGKYALSKSATEMEAEYVNDAGTEPIMQMYGSSSEMPGSVTLYTNMSGDDKYGFVSNALFLPTKKLVDSYAAGDLRKTSWFASTKFYSKVNGNYYRGDFQSFVKYYGNPSLQTNKVYNGAHMAKPYKIGEMYLIKAEAQAQNGNIPGAKSTLKIIQTARGGAQTGGQLEDVQAEWYRETAGEGLRLSCLKRWHIGFDAREGQPGAVQKNVLMTGDYYTGRAFSADDYHLVWPIPASEIRLNPNLAQNDNYGRQ